MPTRIRCAAGLMVVAALSGCTSKDKQKVPADTALAPPLPRITHGVTVGEVGPTRALVWARADGDGHIRAEVLADKRVVARGSATVSADTDHTATIAIKGLEADREYSYRVFAERGGQRSAASSGRFRTAPVGSAKRAVRFAWSGDLAGQNMCRDKTRGFPIFDHILRRQLDFFIALGDMIYADNECDATGLYGNRQIEGDFTAASTIDQFWAHWKYNRKDKGYRKLLAKVPSYSLWDDHEVVNDFGPKHDTRDTPPYRKGERLMPMGLRAFRHYNPMPDGPMYRAVRWGKHLEIVILDNRSFRDDNRDKDDGTVHKTMLGTVQRDFLAERIENSDATWLVVVSSVPISIPTGSDEPPARDGWADYGSGQGFERELGALLKKATKIQRRMLWITTDVHFTSVFRYRPNPKQRPRGKQPLYSFHEAVVGPLNAGLYPKKEFDDTFSPERLLYYAPEGDPNKLSYDEALAYMTYGAVTIDQAGALSLEIENALGKVVYNLQL